MGFQYMFEDPVLFLQSDPEYFEFIVHQMWHIDWTPPGAQP